MVGHVPLAVQPKPGLCLALYIMVNTATIDESGYAGRKRSLVVTLASNGGSLGLGRVLWHIIYVRHVNVANNHMALGPVAGNYNVSGFKPRAFRYDMAIAERRWVCPPTPSGLCTPC